MGKDQGNLEQGGREAKSWVYWLPGHIFLPSLGLKHLLSPGKSLLASDLNHGCVYGEKASYTGQVQELVPVFPTWQRGHLPVNRQMHLRGVLS